MAINNHPSIISQEEIRVRGTVQGVGFRPTVYRLAKACNLVGEVCNDGQGVLIYVSGTTEAIADFVQRLQIDCPPLAKIESIDRTPYPGDRTFHDFTITQSVNSTVQTQIPPDAATCPQCQAETFDSRSRWYNYPFTNCTHCGPRLSIIRSIPYDRKHTSMADFAMCPDCAREYLAIENRRFHAQPIACPVCGPKVWLERANGEKMDTSDPIDTVCTLLKQGEIVAIKGLGGIHLACDATNETTVQQLRSRKQRYHKPFALMARDLEVIEQYCTLNDQEKELFQSPPAPIVLIDVIPNRANCRDAPWRVSTAKIADSVAPGQTTLGFMLPYTPLHHLIMQRLDYPIILTSGNLSDEPQCIDNQDASLKLGKIADYLLLHNRDIVNRVDDSVVRVIQSKRQLQNFDGGGFSHIRVTKNDNCETRPYRGTMARHIHIQTLRRARGYAPKPINLPPGFEKCPPILAMGSELKNTFCLLRDGQAILSQHLGDLENAAAFNAYQDTLNLYLNLFDHKPSAIATDKHPEYLSTKLGQELATANHLSLHPIQHHHAHIAACLAENNIPLNTPPILGIALDGLGYGEDGTIWGGEFLLADYQGFKRLGKFKPIAMIGGEQAIYQPWRNTYAHLIAAWDWNKLKQEYSDLDLIQFLDQKPHPLLNQLIEKGINSPLASSVGRLFDAVAAALGICRADCSYEGQAAIEMEALVTPDSLNYVKEVGAYPFNIGKLDQETELILDPYPLWLALLDDLQQDVSKSLIAAKFHQGLADAIATMVQQLRPDLISNQVILTGGVFQNRILLTQVRENLERMGMEVLTHSRVPPNDGGLSLGQAVIAAAQSLSYRERLRQNGGAD
ncbi:(NiFe) hydrogenase maturation protein HypF [Coleofasciculus chthonoplastes PCC 7420]|uniref:Carbamoyltransferase n=1 Tax=Coleofasciculus chthonoplastes PCC 7420 TaxID=118168 RepID=B4W4C2_9CYAN|nr:carbamoyltransferase HypF [Coleofasciculus chthonoplastes]EDX70934.1 (NiFe) hydrogenase maturation protein HypF [Coleofasciculus chthonoplastes PCC 7420]